MENATLYQEPWEGIMKSKALILFLLLTICNFAWALPQGWEWQQPIPQGYNLNDLSFIDAQTGWAVGDCGTLLHTANGGQNWTVMSGAPDIDLYAVDFVDAEHGWILADTLILRTANGGQTWSWNSVGTGFGWWAEVKFVDTQNGFIGNLDHIFRTTNGGAQWIQCPVSPPELDGWNGMCFSDARHGWAASSGGDIQYTSDGGLTWSQGGTVRDIIFTINFADSLHGWAAGTGISSTNDGGQTWTRQASSFGLRSAFVDPQNGWLLSTPGTLHTSNGGATWAMQPFNDLYVPPQTTFFTSIEAIDVNHAWAVGYGGLIYATNDGGTTWNAQTHIRWETFSDLDMVDARNGWICGVYTEGETTWGRLIRTYDGGRNWVTLTSLHSIIPSRLQFNDELTGWIIANDNSGITPDWKFMRTANGGFSWDYRTPPHQADNTVLLDFSMADAQNGWIAGQISQIDTSWGIIWRTVNGGVSWDVQLTSGYRFNRIVSSDFNHAWALTDDAVWATNDGGNIWNTQTLPGITAPRDIQFLDNFVGWALGGSTVRQASILLNTTDGGGTWSTVAARDSCIWNKVKFANDQEGWMFGAGDSLFHTTNGGASWTAEIFHLGGQGGQGIAWDFMATGEGWMTSWNNIYHYAGFSSGITHNERSVPQTCRLSAYPNPFNPTARIEFNLPLNAMATLAVYDINGRLVRTLESGFMTAGTHSVAWDSRDERGHSVATGIYFCRLSAGPFTATHKLMLLK
jgi:photosystem II stability/assembly factor-like uncharacterized protein